MRISQSIRMIVLLAVLLSGKSASVLAQEHQHGYVRFCNTGVTDLEFTFISREGMHILSDHWFANGIFPVDRNSCEYLAEDVSVAMQIFVGVRRTVQSGESPDVFFTPKSGDSDIRQVNEEFCTKRESFSRTTTMQGHKQCPPGYSLQPFRIAIVLPTLVTFTLRVGETGDPGSSSPQQSTSQAPELPLSTRPNTEKECFYLDDDYFECIERRVREEQQAQSKARDEMEAIQAGEVREGPGNYAEGDHLLVQAVAPIYPSRALTRGIEGHVDVQFTVSETGTVKDVVVVFSTSEIFNRAATRTVLKYRYKPRVVNGQAVEVTNVNTRVTFEITE